jgi:7-cyano-7-deazaguanine synthase
MRRVKSVILLSGGLDSSANLAFARAYDEPLLAITADYGQRAAARELAAAKSLCEYYDVPHQAIDCRWVAGLGSSALTHPLGEMPEPGADQLDDAAVTTGSAKAVWVPNRNGILMNIAAGFAESLGAERIVVGFNREEAATFPDNTGEFLRAMTESLRFSTANRVQAFSYTTELDKREIVGKLTELSAPVFPFERVWSCYQGGPSPCGKCESCRRLTRALRNG